MKYRNIFDPVALSEYKEAISWYQEKSEPAANDFVNEIKRKVEARCDHPLGYSSLYKFTRETSLKKFPYSIVYGIDKVNQGVIILSVYHHKRNPRRKYRKSN